MFNGCDADGVPIDITRPNYSIHPAGDLLGGRYIPYHSPGGKQLIDTSAGEEIVPLKYTYLRFPVEPLRYPLFQQYMRLIPAGDHVLNCKAEIYQNEMVNLRVWWSYMITTRWVNGGATKAGWSPSIIDVDANRDTASSLQPLR